MSKVALAVGLTLLALAAPGSAGARVLKTGFVDPVFADPARRPARLWLDRRAQTQERASCGSRSNWAAIAGPGPPADPENPS